MLLNHAKYRAKLDAVDRREQARVAMSKLRATRKQQLTVNEVNTGERSLTQAEAEAEAIKTPSPSAHESLSGFEKFWKAYPAKIGKIAAQKAFEKHKPNGALLEAMLTALESQRRSDKWQKDGGAFVPNPATWLNQGRWLDVVEVEVQPLVGAHPLAPVSERKPETDEQRRRRLELAGLKKREG